MSDEEKKPLSAGAVIAWTAVATVTIGLFVGTLMIDGKKKKRSR